jgi:hypothetical protein
VGILKSNLPQSKKERKYISFLLSWQCIQDKANSFPWQHPLTYNMQTALILWVISSFHYKEVENYALLDYYAVSNGNFLLTFWDNQSVPSPGFKKLPLLTV